MVSRVSKRVEAVQAKRIEEGTLQWATSVLAALSLAASVISIIQHGFSVDLGGVFEQMVAHYRAIFMPIMEIVQVPIIAAGRLVGIDLVFLDWMKDLHALSFVLAAVFVRGWTTRRDIVAKIVDETIASHRRSHAERVSRIAHRMNKVGHPEGLQLPVAEDEQIERELLALKPNEATGLMHSLRQTCLVLALGVTGLGLFAWYYPFSWIAEDRERAITKSWYSQAQHIEGDYAYKFYSLRIRGRRLARLRNVALAVTGAVVVFYLGNMLSQL